jgi:hypothetical protein
MINKEGMKAKAADDTEQTARDDLARQDGEKRLSKDADTPQAMDAKILPDRLE